MASIERYNELCATGLDEDFGKEKSLMFAVNQPPYYAYAGEKTLGGMLCNTSGVAIDENGQVLARETFRPIPGLFAAGNTAGSRFGIQYTTALCGRIHRLRRHPGQVHRRVRGLPRLAIPLTPARR